MKHILKRSISRKCLRELSARQRKRIIVEIKTNLRSKNSDDYLRHSTKITNIKDTTNLSHAQHNPLTCNDGNDINDGTCAVDMENDILSQPSSDNNICSSDDSFSSVNTVLSDPSFRERLASCFVENNLTHVQGNSILFLLRTHPCFHSLPKDTRTLLNTPRNKIILSTVEPGEYIHFDLEVKISQLLSHCSIVSFPSHLELDFNTDGCVLDKSGTVHIWPIQCRLVNIKHTKPIITGIYRGSTKPYNPNIFFEKFIADVKRIVANGGITHNDSKIPLRLRCFIADAPARVFILNHRGHTSQQPCSKCKISGIRCERRYVFHDMGHSLRTDEEYVCGLDEDHHKEGKSPLSMLPMGMVSQVPFEYMHLVCLGVVKKLLSAWVHGKYSRLSKLSARSISVISARMQILTAYCPSDFARRPRSLDACTKYKATEFRQFLLYTGPVVTYGILNQQVYTHFLLLHAAIRILVSTSPSNAYLNFAEVALQKFVHRCENIYGPTFNSYNIHGLLHIANDVRHLGPLDSFSAFPYENNMMVFRKYCRKPGLLLQQISNRMAEIEAHIATDCCSMDSAVHVSMEHNVGPLPHGFASNSRQYRKIMFNGILLSLDARDNCCILHDGSISIIVNIFVTDNSHYLFVRKFLDVSEFYDVGISSSALHIFKCSTLDDHICSVHINEVYVKCYRMPFWNCMSEDESSSNDDENNVEPDKYIVAAIIHNDKT